MAQNAAELARRLAEQAESVCRTYLSNGRREGSYWLVGDARNSPGRSMFVRLRGGDGRRQIGKWTDAATGEHGDLLDIIRLSRGLTSFADAAREARHFLSLPEPPDSFEPRPRVRAEPSVPIQSARRLLAAGKPLPGTIAEKYLRQRGITALHGTDALRFHPTCFYRDDTDATARPLPALLAAVTDLDGHLTGLHRTWLAADGHAKADVSYPRRAMGHLLGNAVRFGKIGPIIAVGEGIETVLSLRGVLPDMPMLDLLILDDWGPEPLLPEQQRDLLEIVEDRYSAGSLIMTSQVPINRWYEIVGNPTLADAILDRILHNAHRIELKGESLRKQRAAG